jgi:hypothetical protein
VVGAPAFRFRIFGTDRATDVQPRNYAAAVLVVGFGLWVGIALLVGMLGGSVVVAALVFGLVGPAIVTASLVFGYRYMHTGKSGTKLERVKQHNKPRD